jgi:hypothetical protein
MDVFFISGCTLNPETGEIAPFTSEPMFHKQQAIDTMHQLYQQALQEHQLTNNGTSDAEGNAISGGYFTQEECGIYDYVDFAFGQLLEVFYLCIKSFHLNISS